MDQYANFTVDFPTRLIELDRKFQTLAKSARFEVSYLLMKLTASFLLPYERIEGTSGAGRSEISDPQSIRKFLELDKRFRESSYHSGVGMWSLFDVDDFHRGPCAWTVRGETEVNLVMVHKILRIIRHSIAHSNLFFGGMVEIEDIYLGSRREEDPQTDKYRVVRGSVRAVNKLIDMWVLNVQKLRASPTLIWRELEEAA